MHEPEQSAYDAFDRTSGNGSTSGADDFLDAHSIFQNEWGSTAATTFKPSDTDAKGNKLPPDKRQKFEDLYALHNGKGERSRKQDILHSHILNDTKVFVSVLELPKLQRERVMHIIEDLDISSQNFGQNRRYEKIILATCSLVADEKLSERQTDADSDELMANRLSNQERFEELMESVEMTATDHRRIRQQIRQESDYF